MRRSGNILRRYEPLGKHDRAAFSCRHPELENYIKRYASQDARRNISVTTVLLVGESNEVVAYHTLSATRLDLGDLPSDLAKKFPNYAEGVPATLLGRLAVTATELGKGHGEAILMNALESAYLGTKQVGSAFLIVRAIDDEAYRFYEKYGFKPLPSDPRRLFMPMETIAALVDEGENGA